MENIFVKFLPPWIETGLQPAFYDKESGTVLQQTARMYARVNMLIRMFNKLSKNTKTTVEEYITKFNDLYTYVHDYFDNLDVQEEINNKLDDMLEDGSLSEIIAHYLELGTLVAFDTVADMVSSTQLIKGSKCQTLGKYAINDGLGAYYAIDESGDIALANGLYANLIENYGGNNYIDDITVTQIRKFDTDCYVITIPVNDSNGNLIAPHVEYNGPTKTPLEHADDTFTTLTTNASLWIKAPEGSGITSDIPSIIGDGTAIRVYDDFVGSSLADNYLYLGVKADRSIEEFKVNNTTAQNMLSAGVVQAFNVYYKLIEHGVATDLTGVVTNEPDVVTTLNPRQCLGVKADGTWIILTCDGRTGNDSGLTSAQTQSILLELDCYEAWNLDGGGSTSSSYKGSKINRNIDNNGTTERYVPYTLNFRSEIIDKELAKAYSNIGREKQNTLEQVYESVLQNASTDVSGENLDELTNKIIISCGNGMTNRPNNRNGYFVHIPHSSAQYKNSYGYQFYVTRGENQTYERFLEGGSFTKWKNTKLYVQRVDNEAQVINQTDTYEPIQFNSTLINTRSNDGGEIITFKDKAFHTDWGTGITVVRGIVTVNTGTAGYKYLKLMRGTIEIGLVRTKFEGASNALLIPFEFSISSSGTGDYHLDFYGTSGDQLGRRYLTIEIK